MVDCGEKETIDGWMDKQKIFFKKEGEKEKRE